MSGNIKINDAIYGKADKSDIDLIDGATPYTTSRNGDDISIWVAAPDDLPHHTLGYNIRTWVRVEDGEQYFPTELGVLNFEQHAKAVMEANQ